MHKRVFTAIKSRYLKLGTQSAYLENRPTPAEDPSAPEARRDRRGYFLDPWNQPYWFSFHERRKSGPRILLYSFGPDRRRDVDPPRWTAETQAGDDIVVEVPLTKTSTS